MPIRQLDLGYRPRSWQMEAHRSPQRFKVIPVHRRGGKTELSLRQLVTKALQVPPNRVTPVIEPGQFIYLAPFLKQAKFVAWARLKQIVAPLSAAGLVDISEGDLNITFVGNKASIRLFGGDNPVALRGPGLDGVVVDEVAQIKPEVWYDVIEPTLVDRQGWAWFIGTPHGVNLFSDLFFQGQVDKDWYAKSWTVHETQALPEAEVSRMEQRVLQGTYPENTWKREFLCDFTASAEDQLISLTDAMQAATRVYVERDVQHAPRILGVDPARFGDDRSVVVKRQGLQMFDPVVAGNLDNMQLAAAVAATIEEWHPHAVFIDAGAGAGVIDRLRQLGHAIIEVPFGGKAAKQQLYKNRRAEMWFGMKEWVESGGAIPDNQALIQEMATPVYWYDKSTGQRVLEEKVDIKTRLTRSPDIADALALTFAHPVHVPEPMPSNIPRRREGRGWDPFAGY